jgi:hypothetical protein
MAARFCSDTPQQAAKKDSLGFMTKPAVVGYLVFAVGPGGGVLTSLSHAGIQEGLSRILSEAGEL